MTNKAKELLIPTEPNVFRICFLYAGQGDSTILSIPTENGYEFMLIDCNVDRKAGGIDLSLMLKDLTDGVLHYFVNTHPHSDHLRGLKEIRDAIEIKEVWHSGHKPSGDHIGFYEDLKDLIDDLGDSVVNELNGTNKIQTVGKVSYHVLSPAQYVTDEINDESPDERYRRIHENCAVIKFMYGENEKQILITGDADLAAWRDHITEYHSDHLQSTVLSAVHHGSRTFFKVQEEDDPYLDHIQTINASYLVISAPTQEESKHDHPHDDAMALYQEYFDEDAIFHLGKNRECVIVDIYDDGNMEIRIDSELVEEYGFHDDEDGGFSKSYAAISTLTKLDNKPMG